MHISLLTALEPLLALNLAGPGGSGAAVASYQLEEGQLERRVTIDGTLRDQRSLEVEDGCVSCLLRDDLDDLLVALAPYDLDELRVVLPPPVLASGLLDSIRLAPLPQPPQVRVVCVTSPHTLHADVSGDELLVERGRTASAADRRSVAELIVAQLSEADQVVLPVDGPPSGLIRGRAVELIRHLAPVARCVTALDHDFRARPSEADRATLSRLAHDLIGNTGEVRTLVWDSTRPLHPGRTREALNDVVGVTLRSVGQVRFAGRVQSVRWESAGRSLSLGLHDRASVHSELILTGLDLESEPLISTLDGCVLSDAEMRLGAAWWATQDDPFSAALDGDPDLHDAAERVRPAGKF